MNLPTSLSLAPLKIPEKNNPSLKDGMIKPNAKGSHSFFPYSPLSMAQPLTSPRLAALNDIVNDCCQRFLASSTSAESILSSQSTQSSELTQSNRSAPTSVSARSLTFLAQSNQPTQGIFEESAQELEQTQELQEPQQASQILEVTLNKMRASSQIMHELDAQIQRLKSKIKLTGAQEFPANPSFKDVVLKSFHDELIQTQHNLIEVCNNPVHDHVPSFVLDMSQKQLNNTDVAIKKLERLEVVSQQSTDVLKPSFDLNHHNLQALKKYDELLRLTPDSRQLFAKALLKKILPAFITQNDLLVSVKRFENTTWLNWAKEKIGGIDAAYHLCFSGAFDDIQKLQQSIPQARATQIIVHEPQIFFQDHIIDLLPSLEKRESLQDKIFEDLSAI